MTEPGGMRAALRVAEFYSREHGVEVDDFDVQRIARAIEADTGVRELEIKLMNARADLRKILDELSKEEAR